MWPTGRTHPDAPARAAAVGRGYTAGCMHSADGPPATPKLCYPHHLCPPNPAWDDIPAGRQTEIVDSEEPEVREPLNRISTYIEEVVREVLKHVPPDVLSLSSQGALSERTFTARLPLRTGRPQLLAEFLAGRGYAISLAASPRGPVQVLLSPGKFTSEADFYNFTFHLLEYVAMVEDREELERHYHAERPLVFRARL
ncbi:hypothetical protein C8Q80DRAFT_658360 [Daedaleopsis nitida]|nr:hypothetical protein C8Q80DRAFT_658360 [Daedaleopsis nitida]